MGKLALIFATAAAAFAQVGGIVTSASRTVTLSPDEVTFNITVLTELGTTLEETIAAVQDAGISAKNLLAISSADEYYGPPPTVRTTRLAHSFTVTHPYSKLREIAEKLQAGRRTLAANNGDVVFSLYVNATEKSVQDTRQQVVSQLLAEAKANAEFIANAAGLRLGALQTVSENVYPGSGIPAPYYGSVGYSSGAPSPVPIRVSYTVTAGYAAQPR